MGAMPAAKASGRTAEIAALQDPVPIGIEQDHDYGIAWATLHAAGRPGRDLALSHAFTTIGSRFEGMTANAGQAFRHLVTRSAAPGIFGLGFDPGRLAAAIRQVDREALALQIRTAALAHHSAMQAFDLPIVTIALVEGDAIGADFELALAHDITIAERSAKFGFPETMTGLFPAAGAASLLIRRVGRATAERLMLSGALHDSEELHRIGVIDILAEDGCGETAVRDFVGLHAKRFTMQRAVYAARRLVHPIRLTELQSMCELWVGTALRTSAAGLAILDRMAEAEAQRLS